MSQTCFQHPGSPALYVCDGCQRELCAECVVESHVLFLCKHCGERALPKYAGLAASVKDLKKQRIREAPYSLKEALTYPLRGSGLFMYIATLITLSFLWFMTLIGSGTLVTGCMALLFSLAFWGMLVGLQFKIVRSTAEGDNEIPDWPDFTDFMTLFLDLLTWIVIHAVIIFAIAWFLGMGIAKGAFSAAPRLDFWIGFAAVLWLGAAFLVMAYGSVGNYRRLKVFALHSHVQGFIAAGPDALKITNIVFVVGALTFIASSLLEQVPVVGGALSSPITVYWLFVAPHLSGIVFRRHIDKMEKLYWSQGS